MTEERKEPKLRFPGFAGPWEQHKYSDLAVIRRGLTYKPDDIRENGIRVLRSSNIDEDTFVFGNDDVFVAPEAVNIPKVANGDILITSANGSSRLVGKHAIINELEDDSAVHGGFMLLASTKNPYFVNALMSSPWYSKFINTYVAGGNGAIGNLNKNDLDDQTVLVPKEEEQVVIGEFYKNLDNLITLHQRKCDQIKAFKKAMLQKMFPKEGEMAPEIRFPGFTGSWKQGVLSELTDRIIVGLATSVTPYYRESGVPLLRNMNIKENYLDDSDILYLDEEYAKKNESKMIHTNDVLTVHTGSNIGLTCVAPKKYNGSLSFTTLITTPKTDILNSLFLMQYMNSDFGKKGVNSIITAGGKPNLNSNDLEKLTVSYPIIDEQTRIGQFLTNFDGLIALHMHKCDELKELKKGLLQQMLA